MTHASAEEVERGRLATVIRLGIAALVLDLILVQPNHPAAATWGALWRFPLELPAILLGLAALPPGRGVTGLVRGLLVFVLVAGFVLKGADLAMFTALNRAFSPRFDLPLVLSAWQLGSGAAGVPLMAGAVLAAFVAIGAVAALLWWATGKWAAVDLAQPQQGWVAGAFCLAAGLVAVQAGREMGQWRLPHALPGNAFASRNLVERVQDYREATAALRAFRSEAENDPWADVTAMLDLLGGRDVLLVFVESYGASSLRNPLYARTLRPALSEIEGELAGDGLAMRSSWLEAPTFGGQSWLSHATLVSGLWVSNQQNYAAYLASSRQGLMHLAQRAGFRTAGVMPAITMDWPEGGRMGFDTILPASELGYRGQPFNWVTMPDQFTLSALDQLVLDQDGPPVFAEVALVSSHAPWVPIPELVPWEAVGDGTVFDAWATSGDPPEVVWRDPDRVREQFRKAIDYSLSVVGSYAALHADDPPLMIVLGDHPPARFVAEDESDAVPVHIIGPPELVDRIEGWGWTAGMVPDDDAPLWPMSAFRDRFLAAFSSGRPGS